MSAELLALAASVVCVGFDGARAAEAQLDELRDFGPGGVILFAPNIGSGADLRELVTAIRAFDGLAPLVAIDQEGGRVARIADESLVAPVPSAMALGACGDASVTEALGVRTGRDLARLGFSVNFAPCGDLALDPRNVVIGTRSYGEAPYDVARHAAAFARGLERGGVAAAIKHFPGHGATQVDSHLALPHTDVDAATLRMRDLVPFGTAISSEAISIVMTAHIVVDAIDPDVPATLSPRVLTGLLRGELGYDGVIATDCLEMEAIAGTIGTTEGALRALAAGADLLVISHSLAGAKAAVARIAAAVEEGSLPRTRLEAAAARVRALRERYATPMPCADALDDGLALRAMCAAVTVIRGDLRLADGKPVTVISFEGTIVDGAAGPSTETPSLHAALRARRWKSEVMRVPLEPDDDDLDLLLSHLPSLGDRNFVVVMRRAHLYSRQRAAIDRILATVPGTILISAREPHDAALFPQARTIAAIYGDQRLAFAGCP